MSGLAQSSARDVRLLFCTRAVRLFAYGFLSVVLVLHLSAAGLSEARIGLLLTLTLLGDTAISLVLTTRADRTGRRGMLLLGAVLMIFTMVFTHLPSNVLLFLVPVMPTLELAMAALFLRFSISQMDVPTRQSYTMAVVEPEERSAAAGVTGIARTIGSSLAPIAAGPLYAVPALASLPFFIAGGIKIAYDLAVYVAFRKLRPPEERGRGGQVG